MTFNELRATLRQEGYTLVCEDKSLIDETQVYAIYRGATRIARYGSLAGVAKWWNGEN